MRILMLMVLALSAWGVMAPREASAAPICPTTSNTNSDCGFIITLNANGSFTGTAVPNADPYDGNDDALVGVVNNTGSLYKGMFTLTGSGNGGGIFGFDGDGICSYTTLASYCSTAAASTGYEGPLNTFSNISTDQTSGTVDFSTGSGIAIGGTSFFSLEGSPASIAGGGGIGGGGTPVPEPMSLALLGFGVGSLLLARRRQSPG